MSVSVTLIVIMASLYATGIYLMLERSMTRVLLGFLLVGNATNILILIMSGRVGLAPIYDPDVDPSEYADPLPQALMLTAVVILAGAGRFGAWDEGSLCRELRLFEVARDGHGNVADIAVAIAVARVPVDHQ